LNSLNSPLEPSQSLSRQYVTLSTNSISPYIPLHQLITTSKNKFFIDNDLPILESQQITSIENPLTTHELSSIIKTSKTGKTPGPDGLSIEFYASFFPNLQDHLLASLNYAYTTGIDNSNFVNGTIILIFKKGNQIA